MRALKGMIDRAIEQKNEQRSTDLWTDQLVEYDKPYFPVMLLVWFVENSWLFIVNWPELILRPLIWSYKLSIGALIDGIIVRLNRLDD